MTKSLHLPVVALILLSVAVAACGGDADDGPQLLFGSPEGIVQRGVDDVEREILVEPLARSTLANPALSPDGTRMAYTVGNPARVVDGVLGGGADIWIAQRDGSEPTLLYEHRLHTETVSSLAWLDDGHLLAVIWYLDGVPPASRSVWTLARIDASTGERTDMLDDVLSFGICPDRGRLAYVKVESVEEQPLYVANIDGSGEQRLLDSKSGYGGFASPVFSPDGTTLYFAAHEESASEQRGHAADDLFALNIASGEVVKVAAIEATEPRLAMDVEGTHVYAIGGGLYEVVVASGAFRKLDDVSTGGGVAIAD